MFAIMCGRLVGESYVPKKIFLCHETQYKAVEVRGATQAKAHRNAHAEMCVKSLKLHTATTTVM